MRDRDVIDPLVQYSWYCVRLGPLGKFLSDLLEVEMGINRYKKIK